jgi:PGF-pre-PGF domain-containing protein
MGSELGSWTKPSLGQRAGTIAAEVMLVQLLLSPLSAVTVSSSQEAGTQLVDNQALENQMAITDNQMITAENQVVQSDNAMENQIPDNHILIEAWTGIAETQATWQPIGTWTGVVLENQVLDNQITENRVVPKNQAPNNQVVIEVTFDRQLSGHKVGQHKAPPLSPVSMTITATVSNQVDNTVLADYFPSDWSVIDANGGIVSIYDGNYNRIEWDVGAVSDSVSRSYVIRSPQLTSPPTKYYFHSELTYSGGSAVSDDWMVIVADPTIYDYSTGAQVDKWAYSGDAGNDGPPADNTTPSTDIGEGNYAGIASSDDNNYTFTGIGSAISNPTIRFYILISEDPASVTQLDYSWEGYGAAGQTAAFYIWNVTNSTWELVGSHTNGTDTTISGTKTSADVGNYIAPEGAVQLLAVNETNRATVISTDYIKVVVTSVQWNLIETWTGTIEAPIVWQLIETWTGTVRVPAWQLIETWTGTVNAPVQWQLIETWTGTVTAPAQWQVIETWTGAVQAPAQWSLIEEWTGTVSAPAQWQVIETWTGTISAPVQWQLIETWTGTVSAPAQWQAIETWTGTVQAPAQWSLIEEWTGTVQALATWQLIGTWTGTVQAPVVPPGKPLLYTPENSLNTNDNTPTFVWTIGSNADNHRLLVDDDPSFSPPIDNVLLGATDNTWTRPDPGYLDGSYYWKVVAINQEGENESVVWSFTVDTQAPSAPTLVSPTDGTTTDDTTPTFDWSDVTDPSGVTYTLEIIGRLTKTGLTTSTYTLTSGEALSDGDYSWRVRAIDNAGNGSDWSETWSLTVATAPPPPPPPPAPDFSISVSPTSAEVVQGSSTTATVTVTAIEGYSYMVDLSASGQPSGVTVTFSPSNGTPSFDSTLTISVGRSAPVGIHTITITGTGEDGNIRSTTYGLTITPAPPEIPISSVDAITPYWQTTIPFTITATASDNDGYVTDVALWYRYSADTSSWDNWTLFGVDSTVPWSWSFTAPKGDGHYEFHSIARDNDANEEPAKLQAEVRCGVDRAAPPAIQLVSPANIAMTDEIAPIFDWADITDLSGVTYELVVDDSSDFSSPVLSKVGLTTSAYQLSVWEALAEGTYHWRVRAVDGAGNVGEWAGARLLVVRVAIPTVTIGPIPAGGTATADFTGYRISIVKVSITVTQDVMKAGVRALQITVEEFAGGTEQVAVPSGVTYRYFWIVTTNITSSDISSTKVEFRVLRSWLEQNDIDEGTIKLLRWSGSEWQELLTRLLSADLDYLYFEASMEGLSLFTATGQQRVVPPPPVVPTPPSPMPVFFALMAIFGVTGGVAYAYIRWFRPISPRIPLKRLKMPRPAVSLERLKGVITPAISLERLAPAPMTLAPALPVGPLKPVPIVTRPPAPLPRRVMPKTMVPSEVLEHLKRGGRPSAPRISLEGLKQVAKPLEPSIPLDGLKRVARPIASAITLEGLTRVSGPPVKLGIPMKRLERVVRPMKPGIPLKRLKEVVRPLPKPKVPLKRVAARGEEPEIFLKHLKREVFKKKK